MVVTLVFGIWLLDIVTVHFATFPKWLHSKLFLVFLLVGYHHVCVAIHKKLVANTCTWTSKKLRILNEVATFFLVAIVFVAVFKSTLTLKVVGGVLLGFALIMGVGFSLFGRKNQ